MKYVWQYWGLIHLFQDCLTKETFAQGDAHQRGSFPRRLWTKNAYTIDKFAHFFFLVDILTLNKYERHILKSPFQTCTLDKSHLGPISPIKGNIGKKL